MSPWRKNLRDPDVVADHRAGAGRLAMERHDGVEQAVDGQPPGHEVDAEIGREEQVGLPRLDRDARGNPAAVEIPAAGQDVVLGDDPSARQRPRLALDRHDPVHQHQRLVRQPDPRRMGVDRGELGAEHRGDRADGELQALVAVK